MYKIYLLDTLLLLIPRCLLQRKRSTSIPRDFLCFVFLPCTRARHNLKLVGFNSRRINVITSCSLIPNWSLDCIKRSTVFPCHFYDSVQLTIVKVVFFFHNYCMLFLLDRVCRFKIRLLSWYTKGSFCMFHRISLACFRLASRATIGLG